MRVRLDRTVRGGAEVETEFGRWRGVRFLAEPGLALAALTRERSTFTRQDLARFVDTHTAEPAQFDALMARVEAEGEMVRVGPDACGRDRFSTKKIAPANESSGLTG
jgi:hypothetical protein